jgi:ribosomal protein S18 acetylase RimI-like enzyme
MKNNELVEVLGFSEELKEHVKRLNYAWLEKYFRVEKNDVISLTNPKAEIIDKGGHIFFAKKGEEIVGTVSLLKKTDHIFELGKMAVSDKAQGSGIGKILLEHALNFAKQQQGIQAIILYSNTKLESAIHIYRKYGFEEVELEAGLYERADIKMQLLL